MGRLQVKPGPLLSLLAALVATWQTCWVDALDPCKVQGLVPLPHGAASSLNGSQLANVTGACLGRQQLLDTQGHDLVPLQPGHHCELSCVELLNVQLAAPGSESFLKLLSLFTYTTSAHLVMKDVVLHTSCQSLQQYFEYFCTSSAGSAEVGNTWLYIHAWRTPQVEATRVNITCTPSAVEGVVPSATCATAPVHQLADLLQVLLTWENQEQPLIVPILSNITFDATVWSNDPVALPLNIVLIGSPLEATVIDLQLMLGLLTETADAQVALKHLVLINLAPTYFNASISYHVFSLLTHRVWAIERTDRKLMFADTTLVVPQDEYDYMKYWVTIQLSPIRDISARADWLSFTHMQVGWANESGIFLESMTSFTTLYQRVLLTSTFPGQFNNFSSGVGQLGYEGNVPLTSASLVKTQYDFVVACNYSLGRDPFYMILVSSLSIGGSNWPTSGVVLSSPVVIAASVNMHTPVVMDLQRHTGMMLLADGAQIRMDDLVLTGLPVRDKAYNASRPASVFAFGLWFYVGSQGGPRVTLRDCTVVLHPDELAVLVDVAGLPDQPRLSLISDDLLAYLQSWFENVDLQVISDQMLVANEIATPRFIGSNITFVSATSQPGAAPLPSPYSLGVPQQKPQGSPLVSWQIALIVCLSALAAASTAVGVFLLARRMRKGSHSDAGSSDVGKLPHAASPQQDSPPALDSGGSSGSSERHASDQLSGKTVLHDHVVVDMNGTAAEGKSGDGDSFNQPPDDTCHPSVALDASPPAVVPSTANFNLSEQLHHLTTSLSNDISDKQLAVHEVLGSGAYGVVYRGTWRGLQVAIKTLFCHQDKNSERHQRALLEAAISTNLAHRNIVTTYAYEIKQLNAFDDWKMQTPNIIDHHTAWRLCIVQEYCNGGTLTSAIDKGFFFTKSALDVCAPCASSDDCASVQALDVAKVVNAALSIASGLQHIHSKNIIHGDLNPNNVLLLSASAADEPVLGHVVKIADFGLSVRIKAEQSHLSNLWQGTPNYVAPEVVLAGQISKPADVWAFGVLLYELQGGTPPWRHQRLQTFPLVDTSIMSFSPACPAAYVSLALSCLSHNKEKRPNMDEVVQALQALRGEHADL